MQTAKATLTLALVALLASTGEACCSFEPLLRRHDCEWQLREEFYVDALSFIESCHELLTSSVFVSNNLALAFASESGTSGVPTPEILSAAIHCWHLVCVADLLIDFTKEWVSDMQHHGLFHLSFPLAGFANRQLLAPTPAPAPGPISCSTVAATASDAGLTILLEAVTAAGLARTS